MKTLIVVPARYGSTRFPGKPLAMIAGRSMVARVADAAIEAANALEDADYVVATDDQRIIDHCAELGLNAVMTPVDCESGTDRALAAVSALGASPEVIVNLQGDAPYTPAEMVIRCAKAVADSEHDCATPVVRLTWDALDRLRKNKETTPFSGTTCVRHTDGRAIWFSKNILPAIRREDKLRQQTSHSPVFRHVGLYAYKLKALERFTALPPSTYEQIEGLEQLRMLENGMTIEAVEVEEPEISLGGIDTQEDLTRLEATLAKLGLTDAPSD